MSSAGYETGLSPDRRLRRALAGACALAAATGAVLLLALPLEDYLRLALAALWLLLSAREALRLRRGMARLDRIVLRADGRLRGRRGGGPWRALELAPGTVIGARWGWLRLRFEDGLSYGELLREHDGNREAWRRLRIIWRHRGAFGRPGRS